MVASWVSGSVDRRSIEQGIGLPLAGRAGRSVPIAQVVARMAVEKVDGSLLESRDWWSCSP
jgi:hypothetical protein